MGMKHIQEHLPSYLERIALSKQPPSVLVLGQSETDVQPVDHDTPTHSKENEGVKDETQDRREGHLGWATDMSQLRSRPQVFLPLFLIKECETECEFTHDHVIHSTGRKEEGG